MGDLTPAETDAHLHLVAALQELDGVLRLGLNVVFLDGGGKLHLFHRDGLLVFAHLALAFGLLIAMLVVVHQLAYRRLGIGHDLDQIQLRLFRQLHCAGNGQHAKLSAVSADQTYLSVADFFIDHQFSGYVDAPPSWFRFSVKKKADG